MNTGRSASLAAPRLTGVRTGRSEPCGPSGKVIGDIIGSIGGSLAGDWFGLKAFFDSAVP